MEKTLVETVTALAQTLSRTVTVIDKLQDTVLNLTLRVADLERQARRQRRYGNET